MQYHEPVWIPAHLTTGEPDSFAAFTLEERLPAILDNLANHADARTDQALQQLAVEIREGEITPLPPVILGLFDQVIKPYTGRRWTDMPFLTVELYFYARILLAFAHTATTLVDPFHPIKNTVSLQAIESLTTMTGYCDSDCDITGLLRWSMTGNTADLSQQVVTDAGQISLLVDESYVAGGLFDSGLNRIDFVFDNAGMDVLTDLLLILRISRHCSRIVAHVRPWPMFVSDVTMTDMKYLIRKLVTSSIPAAKKLGEDITQLLHQNRLIFRSSSALGLPVCFCEEEALTRETFENTELVIFKGDLNYRYFVGDRRWPHTMEKRYFFERFSQPAICLRTLKSEVLVGLPADIATRTLHLQPDWLTSGRYGIIQVFAH